MRAGEATGMTEHQSSRTLVKSTPELWAECSDAGSLARHLGAFGEIRITKLEPESAVAWEGAAACGTVRLEPAGWGTRVTLTATEATRAGSAPAPAAGLARPDAGLEPRPGRWSRLMRMLRRRPAGRSATADPAAQAAQAAQAAPPKHAPGVPAAPEGETALSLALDSLGRAHRRPYSRA